MKFIVDEMPKKLRAQINGYYRRKRYAKRQKERARRRALKGTRYQ